jgi:hypothetical protein
LAAPGSASAAQIKFAFNADLTFQNAILVYSDPSSAANTVTIGDYSPSTMSLEDPGVPIQEAPSAPPETSQYCSPQTGSVSCGPIDSTRNQVFKVRLGPGDDSATNDSASSGYDASTHASFDGGPGDDTLKAGVNEVGQAGNDTLIAGDRMVGGPGGDDFVGEQIDCGPYTPVYVCGSVVDYSARSRPSPGVSVSLDNLPNDGRPGEGDNVHSGVRQVFGTTSGDSLTGDAEPNLLDGNRGPDVLTGRGGDDGILGDDGSDVLKGGPGADFLNGGPGDDRLYTRDGQRDTVYCGGGFDVARVDPVDKVAKDCEIIRRG